MLLHLRLVLHLALIFITFAVGITFAVVIYLIFSGGTEVEFGPKRCKQITNLSRVIRSLHPTTSQYLCVVT